MTTFHERFRQLAKKANVTQTTIARELGTTPQGVSYYMNGREPDYETLIKIAKYFHVSIDYLLGVSNNEDHENQNIAANTSLSPDAVRKLKMISAKNRSATARKFHYIDEKETLSKMICTKYFEELIEKISLYRESEKIGPNSIYNADKLTGRELATCSRFLKFNALETFQKLLSDIVRLDDSEAGQRNC
ncbi:XRE family transcriptional regulator [Butyricicoccus sp. 1XD8-22]|nr:XRE family transcriptional regulator [Butyricicoccus sp. 1XD8-22]